MKKHIIYALGALLLSGCAKETELVDPTPQNETTTVTFNFATEQPVATTRATNAPLADIQLLLVNIEDETKRYYYDLGSQQFLVADINPGIYDIYASANHSEKYGSYSVRALASVYIGYNEKFDRPAMGFSDRLDLSTGKPLFYPIKLVPTVAKLQVNVKAASGITITRMSLCSVRWRAPLFPKGKPEYQTSNEIEVTPTNGAFTAYVPENLQGTVASITDQKQRTAANAPSGATYLKIEGELADKTHVEYVVYLGGNTTDDFNVRRNWDYRININILDASTLDARITTYKASHAVIPIYPSADGKYCHGVVYLNQSFKTSAEDKFSPIKYKYVFTGVTPGKLTLDFKVLNDNTFSGTLTNGQNQFLILAYTEPIITIPNHKVTYTLTFTDAYGGTTEYTGEIRFANKVSVYVPKINSNSIIPKSDITVITKEASTSQSDVGENICYTIYSPNNTLEISIGALRGYTFRGWYTSSDYSQSIGSSSVLSRTLSSKESSIWAKFD